MNDETIKELQSQIKAKDKWISELLKRENKYKNLIELKNSEIAQAIESNFQRIQCPTCGTTELLCGHNGVGCTSECNDKE